MNDLPREKSMMLRLTEKYNYSTILLHQIFGILILNVAFEIHFYSFFHLYKA